MWLWMAWACNPRYVNDWCPAASSAAARVPVHVAPTIQQRCMHVQVGVVMPDGTVLSSARESIGCVNFGDIAPHQTVLGVNGVPLGILQPDGFVVSAVDGRCAGLLAPSGRVLDAAGRVVGTARTACMEGLTREADGTVRDEAGVAVGLVAADGNIIITKPLGTGQGGTSSYGTAAMEVRPLVICLWFCCRGLSDEAGLRTWFQMAHRAACTPCLCPLAQTFYLSRPVPSESSQTPSCVLQWIF